VHKVFFGRINTVLKGGGGANNGVAVVHLRLRWSCSERSLHELLLLLVHRLQIHLGWAGRALRGQLRRLATQLRRLVPLEHTRGHRTRHMLRRLHFGAENGRAEHLCLPLVLRHDHLAVRRCHLRTSLAELASDDLLVVRASLA